MIQIFYTRENALAERISFSLTSYSHFYFDLLEHGVPGHVPKHVLAHGGGGSPPNLPHLRRHSLEDPTSRACGNKVFAEKVVFLFTLFCDTNILH